jgi:hypothetical protein
MITGHELRRVVLSLPEAEERETWGVPAHVGRHGWVSIQLATVDPTELGELGGRGVAPDRPQTPGRRLRRRSGRPGARVGRPWIGRVTVQGSGR